MACILKSAYEIVIEWSSALPIDVLARLLALIFSQNYSETCDEFVINLD